MPAQKVNVVYVKRVEDRDKKTGQKIVTAAGTKAQLTEAEYNRVKHAVRVIKDEAEENARPVLASGKAPEAGGNAGEGDGEGDGEGNGDGDDGTGSGSTGG